MVMNADGSNEREITRSNYAQSTWSPDSAQIAFTRCGNIFAVNQGSGAERQLTFFPTSSPVEFPDWSPDARQIAYVLCASGCHIHVMNADGSGDVTVTHDGQLNLFPRWSPDGGRLTFMSNRDPTPHAYEHIWTMRADGSDPIRLTDGVYDEYPTWPPDGRQIVYTQSSTNLGVGGLRSVAPDGTGDVLLKAASSTDLPAPDAADWQSIPQGDAVPPVVTLSSPQQDAVYNLPDPVLAAYSCTDEGGSGLSSCAGPVPDGDPIDTATIGAKTFTVTATGTTVSAGAPTPESGATAEVVVPPGTAGGAVTIGAYDVSTPEPAGYQLLNRQLHIDAPSATWDNPLRLIFTLDPSLLPPSTTAADMAVFRDGALVADCPPGATTALPPDEAGPDGYPCVSDRQTRPDGAARQLPPRRTAPAPRTRRSSSPAAASRRGPPRRSPEQA